MVREVGEVVVQERALTFTAGDGVIEALAGYRALFAASIHGRTTSRFSEAHRLAPTRGSSSSLITVSRSLICASVSSRASMNAWATGSASRRPPRTMVEHSAGSFV